MNRDFRGFGAEPEVAPPGRVIAKIVENDPKVPWAVGVVQNGPLQGERTYLFPPDWTPEMQDRALLEWRVN